MKKSKLKSNLLPYILTLLILPFVVSQYSCKSKAASLSNLAEPTYKPHTVPIDILNDSRKTWHTVSAMDTVITVDPETMEKKVSINRIEYQYTIDTVVVFDSETFEETISIVTTYRGAPPGFFGI